MLLDMMIINHIEMEILLFIIVMLIKVDASLLLYQRQYTNSIENMIR